MGQEQNIKQTFFGKTGLKIFVINKLDWSGIHLIEKKNQPEVF